MSTPKSAPEAFFKPQPHKRAVRNVVSTIPEMFAFSRGVSSENDTRRFGVEPKAPSSESFQRFLNEKGEIRRYSTFPSVVNVIGLPRLRLKGKIEFPEDRPRNKQFWIGYKIVIAVFFIGLFIYLAQFPPRLY